MCAILDANVVGEVFGDRPTEAGIAFHGWLNSDRGLLVSGGQLHDELNLSGENFRRWARIARNRGRLKVIDNKLVEEREKRLLDRGPLKSNDSHIIALALVSGARLLYTDDGKLQKDFGNRALIDSPPGKVLSTKEIPGSAGRPGSPKGALRSAHKKLLANRNLCRSET